MPPTPALSPVRELCRHDGLRAFALAPQGLDLATSCDRNTCLWRTKNGEHRATLPQSGEIGLAFSPSGDQLALCSGTHLAIWDVARLAVVWRIDISFAAEHGMRPNALWWPRRGGHVVLGGLDREGAAYVLGWNVVTREVGIKLRLKTIAHEMDLSADERFLLTARNDDREVMIWDLEKRKVFKHINTRGGQVRLVRLSSEGDAFVTVSEGGSKQVGKENFVELWSTRARQVLFWDVLDPEYQGLKACFTHDGRFCCVNHWDRIHIWDVAGAVSQEGTVRSPLFSMTAGKKHELNIKDVISVAKGEPLYTFHADNVVRSWKWPQPTDSRIVSRVFRALGGR